MGPLRTPASPARPPGRRRISFQLGQDRGKIRELAQRHRSLLGDMRQEPARGREGLEVQGVAGVPLIAHIRDQQNAACKGILDQAGDLIAAAEPGEGAALVAVASARLAYNQAEHRCEHATDDQEFESAVADTSRAWQALEAANGAAAPWLDSDDEEED